MVDILILHLTCFSRSNMEMLLSGMNKPRCNRSVTLFCLFAISIMTSSWIGSLALKWLLWIPHAFILQYGSKYFCLICALFRPADLYLWCSTHFYHLVTRIFSLITYITKPPRENVVNITSWVDYVFIQNFSFD